MSTDTERRLVAALQAGAAVILVDPAAAEFDQALVTASEHRAGVRQRPPRWAIAAVAALVLAIAVVAFVLHKPPKPHPANPFKGLTCTVPLPSSWTRASDAFHLEPSRGDLALTVAPDGDVIAATNSIPQRIFVVHGGVSSRLAYTVPADKFITQAASTDGRWFAFELGTASGRFAGIAAVDLDTGSVRGVRGQSTSRTFVASPPVYYQGGVFWGESERQNNQGLGAIYRYDLASGQRERASDHFFAGPIQIPGAVAWLNGAGKLTVHGTPELPPGFTLANIADNIQLSGTTAAWTTAANPGRYFVSNLDGSERTLVYQSKTDTSSSTLLGFAAQYVLIGAPGGGAPTRILDVRTGASVLLNDTEYTRVTASGSTLAFTQPNHGTGPPRLVVLNLATLPEPTC